MSTTKTVVITGANSGIGRATAEILATKGYNIITICRKKPEGDQTAEKISALNPAITAENFTCDLSDLAKVKKTGELIREKYPVIDRLINNAGYYPASIEFINGVEKSFVASHLGHMLLTRILRPSLERSPEARVISVSSALLMNGRVSRFFKKSSSLNPSQAYGDDKLANALFTMALAKDLPQNVTAYSLHPGIVNTNFSNTVTGAMKIGITLFGFLFITPEKGAATSVYLANENIEKLKAHTGGYFAKEKAAVARNKDVTEANALALWKKSEEFLAGI